MTTNEIYAELLKGNLEQFTGTEHYYRHTQDLVLTDGTKHLAENAGCYWLMDVIASYLDKIEGGFAIAELTVTYGNKALFTLADDRPANKFFADQGISYTDFPLEEIKLYVIRDEDHWVCLLPSEY